MNKTKLMKMTTSYHDDLIQSLQKPKEAYAYLQVAIEEYQQDGDAEFLLVALRNVAEAQGELTSTSRALCAGSSYHAHISRSREQVAGRRNEVEINFAPATTYRIKMILLLI